MAKLKTVFFGFSALLVFGVLSIVLTCTELAFVYPDSRTRDEPSHREVAEEWENEDRDLVRARQKTLAQGQDQAVAGLNVGRVLAKYNSEADQLEEKAANAADVQAEAAKAEMQKFRIAEQKRRVIEQTLNQKQLALQLNWTASVISASPHFQDVKNKLTTLADLKRTKLRLDTGIKELWAYLRHQLQNVNFTEAAATAQLLHSIEEQLALLSLHATDAQSIIDSYIGAGWREKMSTELSELMQRRLHYLQNPKDCGAAKKLFCRISKPCGFGCQIHHVAYCFVFAYATQRMLVVDAKGWRYAAQWDDVFLPLSSLSNCTLTQNTHNISDWESYMAQDSPAVIQVPSIDSLGSKKPRFLPMAVPRDLIDRLKIFHGYPFVWFIGQFLQYLMRPSLQLRWFLDERQARLKITHPIVGVHIRRTDKLDKEASFHSIEEYMTQVEEWYAHRRTQGVGGEGGRGEKKRVFLATDDQFVLKQAKQIYPDYEFISDNGVSKTAGTLSSRYSQTGLYGVVMDVLMLAECDYIVCTFSSQVCRLAYELMQPRHTDASRQAYSLDDVYYFGGQQVHQLRAFHGHTKWGGGDLKLSKDDLIKIAGNHHNGFSLGNSRQGRWQQGLVPSYKVEEETIVADFPTYSEVL